MGTWSRKKLLCFSWIVMLAGILLYSAVLLPVYVNLTNDVIYMYTVWPNILEIVYSVVELLIFWFGYAVSIYAFWRFTRKEAVPFAVLFGVCSFLKYFINVLMTWLTDGIPVFTDMLSDMGTVLIYTAIDFVLYLIILFICLHCIRKRMEIRMIKETASRKLGWTDYSAKDSVFPYGKIFDFSNPILISACIAASGLTLVKIITRIIYDVSGVSSYYVGTGAVQIVWMVAYYLLDLAIGLIGYLCMIFLCLWMHKKLAKENIVTKEAEN